MRLDEQAVRARCQRAACQHRRELPLANRAISPRAGLLHGVRGVEDHGEARLLERGTTFGYNNLVSDMRAIPVLKQSGFPVVFDATHSVQQPGAGGDRTIGQREFAPLLARCALTAGADGLFIETHPEPDKAMSDGPNMIPLSEMEGLLKGFLKVRAAVR